MNKSFSRRYLILIILLIFALIGFLVFFFVHKTTTVFIHVAPTSATITIDGKNYQNHTYIKLQPGQHHVLISSSNFVSKEFDLTFDGRQTVRLDAYLLSPNNDFSYYETNADDLYFLNEYLHHHPDDTAASDFLSKYYKNQSVQDILPLYSHQAQGSYYIFYRTGTPSCARLYCLEIGASSKELINQALTALKEHSYNPDDYEIFYTLDDSR